MLLIFSPSDTNRLQYALQLVFFELLGIEFEFTTDAQNFSSHSGPKLNYSRQQIGSEIFVYAEALLFEKEIKAQTIATGIWNNIQTIFHHDHKADLPFDPFAAVFYLVSRYEEYLPFREDEHGRFAAEESLNYRGGFHEVPVVNHYAHFIKQLIQSRYPGFIFPEKNYRFRLTYDIDMAFAFREKGALRNAGGFLKSLSHLNLKEIALRTKVLTGQLEDPFDTFSYQKGLNEKYALDPVYFFLLGDHSGYDKSIPWRNKFFTETVKQLSDNNEIGIHASYESNRFPDKLKTEIGRLEKMSGKKVFRNRQHFLKLRFPATYRMLISAGITEDYTMGYSSQVGFRAGIAAPFRFYDLGKEETTALVIYPFAVMDASLHYHLKLSPGAAFEKSKQILAEVKKVNGTCIFLAHNDLIGDEGPWPGWRPQFEKLIEYARS